MPKKWPFVKLGMRCFPIGEKGEEAKRSKGEEAKRGRGEDG